MTQKNTHNGLDSLLKTMNALRQPDGCPWDAEQTPESLAPYIMEEACELIDAIESGDTDCILDELGDLLLQVVFQAQIYKERQIFDFDDVATTIADKLIRRHPHVFSQPTTDASTEELNRQWDEIKKAESTNNKSCLADHLPKSLPALQRAQKLTSKSQRADRYQELTATLGIATEGSSDSFDETRLGEELFSIVIKAHHSGLDAETALRKAIARTLSIMDETKE